MNYDLITVGRVSMDLFSLNIGAPFVNIEAFDTGVGGSPTNIAIGSARLGLKVAALTAVGSDPVGDFVIKFLEDQSVDTRYVIRKPGTRTPLAVLGIEPPDKFPLVFYRENPADIHLTLDDALAAPIAESRALLLSGTALSRGSGRDATLCAAEIGRNAETTVFLDLDMRPGEWPHPRSYGLNVRTILDKCDVIIGTEEEFYGALAPLPDAIMSGGSLDAARRSELENLLAGLLAVQPGTVLVVKRGGRGVTLYNEGQIVPVEGFPVEVLNTVGAGDAFASGLITARIEGRDWPEAARFANACGAIVVTRHGCAKAMPHLGEVKTFIEERTGP